MLKRKWPLMLLFGLSVSFVMISCEEDNDDEDQAYTLSGNATAAQEVPALNTTTFPGTGTLTGTYNASTNTLQYNITWTGLSGVVTAAHFHGPADVGETAGPVVSLTITNSAATGAAAGSDNLTEAQEADLLAGRWYYNIHTGTNINGEIRAQVVATPY